MELRLSRGARALCERPSDLLQPIQKCYTDPFKALSECEAPIKTLQGLEPQMISLVQGLFEFSGGIVDCRQHALDQDYTASDNLNLYMILVGVAGTKRFGDFDPKEISEALLKSKVFVKDSDIGTLDTVGWSKQIMRFLPIGFPEGHLVLHCERRAQLLLTLVGSSISGVKRIELRRGGSCWHILVIPTREGRRVTLMGEANKSIIDVHPFESQGTFYYCSSLGVQSSTVGLSESLVNGQAQGGL